MSSRIKKSLLLVAVPLMIIPLLYLPLVSTAPQQFIIGAYITQSFSVTVSTSGGSAHATGTFNFTITEVAPPNLTLEFVWYIKANGAENTETGAVVIDMNTRIIISSTHLDFYMEVGDYCDLWIPTGVDIGSEVQIYDDTWVIRSSAFFNGYECWDLTPLFGVSDFHDHMYYEKETGICLGVTGQGNMPGNGHMSAHVVMTSTNIDALSNITGTVGGFPWWIIIVAIVVVVVAISVAVLWRRRRVVPPVEEEAPETPEEVPIAPPTAKFCPHCGTENLLEALFCANCGSSLEGR